MIGHSQDDDRFRVLPGVVFGDTFVSDASEHIDEADKGLDNDNRLIVSDDE